MSRSSAKVLGLSVALGVGVWLGVGIGAWAQGPSANVHHFAGGLNNPRGLKFGPDGKLYVAEGGAGPLFAAQIALEVGTPWVLVPNFPGQFSAFGFTMANARVDRYRTVQLNSRFFDAER